MYIRSLVIIFWKSYSIFCFLRNSNIEQLQMKYKLTKSFKDHSAFHKYYPMWLCSKQLTGLIFLSSRSAGFASKLELDASSNSFPSTLSWYARIFRLVRFLHNVMFMATFFFIKFLTKFLNKMNVRKGRLVSNQNHDSTYTYTRFPILQKTSWKINSQIPYQIS